MKKMNLVYYLVASAILILNNSCKPVVEYDMNEYLELNNNWSFRMKGENEWLPAIVPGCVHTDLLTNSKIAQPFYRTNEKDLQWIDKNDWIYQCTFMLDSQQVLFNKTILTFYGLDTYAQVRLNDLPILDAGNMFRCYEVDVTGKLMAGNNTLEIEFLSPIRVGLEKREALG